MLERFILKTMYKKILHIGNHTTTNKNAGDTLLFPVTRSCFDIFNSKIDWSLHHVLKKFSLRDAQNANSTYDEILIGGGGMFLRDQDGSDISKSGWQWNCSIEALSEIKIPINVFGVGYNRFRGQEDFDSIFTDHINTLVQKANFVGLRNSGSIKSIQNYLYPDLKEKLSLQFCPTTCLWQINKSLMTKSFKHRKKNSKHLAFNAALDRVEMRFPNGLEKDIINIVKSLELASKRGWKIIVVAHKHLDLEILKFLDKVHLTYEVKNLTECDPNEICDFYSEVDCSFGMRGHSQLIPLGLRKPILSIITHNKMKYLLEDIDHEEWGLEIDDSQFIQNFERLLEKLISEKSQSYEQIDKIQENIWKQTNKNFLSLK